jgi:hypothetical protein
MDEYILECGVLIWFLVGVHSSFSVGTGKAPCDLEAPERGQT